MKARIRTTAHANLNPGDPVEVLGYVARVTARFETTAGRTQTESRTLSFGLHELAFDSGITPPEYRTAVDAMRRDLETPEIPADLPLTLPSTGFAPESPTAAPQSPEKAYLADILLVMRNIHELLIEYIQSHP